MPYQNGRYINPPPGKRALRDPYGDWWDKQERRNFGEPVHEDNDLYAVFSTEPYTHTTPGKAGFQISCFVAATLGLCGAVYQVYPDRPAVKKSFPAGLETELGGKGAWTVGLVREQILDMEFTDDQLGQARG